MEIYQTESLEDIIYESTNKRKLTLDIIKPINQDTQSYPAIIYVHGGGWMAGDKKGPGGEWNASFAQYGFVCININYRLSGEAIFPAALIDVKTAICWVREHADEYQIDPNKIGIWGHSSGGHLASLAALTSNHSELSSPYSSVSDHVRAAVSLSGPTDLAKMGTWHDFPNSPEAKFLGGAVQTKLELAKKANPITYCNEDKTIPFLIIHGDNDPICPVNQSELLHQALPNSTYLNIKGADHDLVGGNITFDEILEIIRGFFTRQLVKRSMGVMELMQHRKAVKEAVSWFINSSK